MNRTLVICVNYHDEENACRFVRDLLKQRDSESLEIIVVDTSERADPHPSLIQLQKIDSRVLLLCAGKNMGYLGAANWALLQYLKKNDLPNWIIISNADIYFLGYNIISNLYASYSESKPVIIAPSIISTQTKLDQNPHLVIKPRKLKIYFRCLLLSSYYLYMLFLRLYSINNNIRALIKSHKKMSNMKVSESNTIYALHGSFMILPSEYFKRGGDLNYEPFLYGEEYFIAENAKSLGLNIIYDPTLQVFHNEHTATGKALNKVKWKHLVQSNSFCLKKYYNVSFDFSRD